ncbi:branched-chain amino acid aminotransferase [Elusimicrobium simillimum]|uniref:branched-chain amino acid aminotransferase n=1 Tax=Elusimicrobium simillimum TaxID=3143438 RepID=UPI003C6F3D9A
MQDIKITLTKTPKQKVTDTSALGFGKYFSDHMFVMDYDKENGWHNAQILPFGPIELSPSAMVLHYGQEVFEGMKAYKAKDGRILLFRPQENFKRLNASNDRLAIPQIDEDFALEALKKLVNIDKDWIPEGTGPSLYIRPFIIATQPNLGVKISDSYKFIIIMSPVGSYFKAALTPTNILVEDTYVRAVRGGMGAAKTGGNYASALKAQDKAAKQDCSQVLWLDGIEHKYIEEVGAMNVFFVIGDEVITPALNGSILSGITRKSVIEMLSKKGYKVVERRLGIEEVYEASQKGMLKEMFGSGTAAIVSPVGILKWQDKVITINDNKTGPVTELAYNTLLGLQTGALPDDLGWTVEVK